MSETKVRELEDMSGSSADEFCFRRIPRSREVGQSYVSSVVTTLRSQLSCLPLVLDIEPGLVLGNGPGTCVPIFFVCFALRFLGLRNNTKLMYVESVARVKNLSLTGKIIYKLGLCDNFLVQWPTLAMKYPRATYIGRLI
ncbi:hypothetical protein SARC_04778 [Sphaeroforma arctica JP610]|uniref:UDP-N-acetylglucosamine transferase subunit ALG14 n=1 Tax=Sphaeroforma arctica JP610 TaxID=667725 RepID=A0A0L0G2A2_9EUKA|nr:hypothetical protein SARC_04778 [Sphaeroforma arctica JP610]KNC82956.1 hypothetical protein SARC_04778 [Sphaeroforma arctica JP610]|eukprot:XP_014156858.1 hypothetical protein SARC_04778 [Sphaeroforma arctica JP610]